MSRFGDARWQRLAVWSGAALAWGSTLTAVVLEPTRAAAEEPSSSSETQVQPALPTSPGNGILIIRYQPEPEPEPQKQVRTVTVTRPATAAPASTAPQPSSSGS